MGGFTVLMGLRSWCELAATGSGAGGRLRLEKRFPQETHRASFPWDHRIHSPAGF
jgi:hypothetical protein